MAKLKVLTYPNAILKKKAKPVLKVDSELKTLARNMLETMVAENGIGLAAPQIGQSLRLVVVDTRPRDEEGKVLEEEMTDLERGVTYPLTLFNPEVLSREGSTSYEEGCLSVPGYYGTVKRAERVDVQAIDPNGKTIRFQADGLLAICVQHEIDHLDGILFFDRMSTVKAELIKSKIKKHGYPKKSHASEEPDEL